MKRIKPILVTILSLLALLLASCQHKPQADNSEERISPAAPEIDLPPASATNEPALSVEFEADALLDKYNSFDEFIEFEDEDYQKIVFISNTAIRDFKFIEVGHKEEESGLVFFENAVLYSLDELSPEKPLVVTWREWGITPHRGISFLDENDTTRYFYIAMSGEDGGLLLVEF